MVDAHLITSLEALEALYGRPTQASLAKETPQLTHEYRKWIEASPFLVIASSGENGIDCSPRGDEAGRLLRILDETTIVLPDRRGNNRLDTARNLLTDPRVSLLFFLPGINETLRVVGDAKISTDPQFLDSFEHKGKRPVTVIIVSISSVFFQCGRALIRSKLWEDEHHVDRSSVPTAGEMIKAAVENFDAEDYDAELPDRQKSTLY